ncbi:GNAT family N-acetyltransferase [Thalassiella azotivora]
MATRGGDDVVVRAVREDELDAAGRVVADAYAADGLAHDDYLDVIADARTRARDAEVLVAVDGAGQLLGSVTFTVPPSPWAELSGPGEAEFRMLGVAPGARGRGVGEALVRACVDRARALGATRLRLCTQPESLAAHRLYGRYGFTRDPLRDWTPVPGIDLLAYVLELRDASGVPAVRAPAPGR